MKKIYILYARENWITDVLVEEWVGKNSEYYTTDIKEAEIIWVLSHYVISHIPREILESKFVVTTIHHIVPWKVDKNRQMLYNYVNSVTNVFHSICDKTTKCMLKFGFDKPIITIPFWNNEQKWYDMSVNRSTYGLKDTDFLIGSFQRDTEGAGISRGIYEPKLEKGPDIFISAVKLLRKRYENVKVILTGRCRQYVMKELKRIGVEYYYFEMCDMTQLNELYNILDLYIVGSRVEGGPRAINEASLTHTPLYSTDVGIASKICHPDSIYDMNSVESILSCKSDMAWNYEHAMEYSIERHMTRFMEKVFLRNGYF